MLKVAYFRYRDKFCVSLTGLRLKVCTSSAKGIRVNSKAALLQEHPSSVFNFKQHHNKVILI